MIDREIGNYWVLEQLSAGPDGAAFKGVHKTLDQDVVIWELPESAFSDAAERKRFVEAANLLKNATPQQVLAIYLCLEQKDAVLLVTEFAPCTLEERLSSEGPLPLGAALYAGQKLADTLQYLHSFQIVHGHISPRTVFFAADGTVKLGFFSPGTPPSEGSAAPSPAADLFSLGTTLCRMLGAGPTLPTAPRASHGAIDPADSDAAALAALRDILAKATAADESCRFRSARELSDALKGVGDKASTNRDQPATYQSRLRLPALAMTVLICGITISTAVLALRGRHPANPVQEAKIAHAPSPTPAAGQPRPLPAAVLPSVPPIAAAPAVEKKPTATGAVKTEPPRQSKSGKKERQNKDRQVAQHNSKKKASAIAARREAVAALREAAAARREATAARREAVAARRRVILLSAPPAVSPESQAGDSWSIRK